MTRITRIFIDFLWLFIRENPRYPRHPCAMETLEPATLHGDYQRALTMPVFALELAGQHWEIKLSDEELEHVHLPLLNEITRKAAAKTGRYLVLLAGPPGSGKTTLGVLWAQLAQEYHVPVTVQALPMDGFHFPNAELDVRAISWKGERCLLRRIKGAPETYDFTRLRCMLHELQAGRDVAWPKYDRQLHDPVPDALPVIATGVLILEGNYLLLDEPGWRDLVPMADLTIFVECDDALGRERVLARATRGGRAYASAAQHYEFTDKPNRIRIMQHRLESDVVLRVESNGRILRIQ